MNWERYKNGFFNTYVNENYGHAGCGGPILKGIMLLLLLFLLCSCKTVKYIPVETVRTEYIHKTDTLVQKDSVFLKDSVFIHAKGDTVWYEKWHTKYVDRWKERVVCDTLIKADSIRVPYPVEKELTRWQAFCLDFGMVTTGGCIVGIIVAALWIVSWIRKKHF